MRPHTGSTSVFKPCVIIPVYNHQQVIAEVVARLRQLELPCFLVDDGSDPDCHAVLAAIADGDDGTTLIRLEHNCGKGVAVCRGLAEAHRQGYSHALQIDADGQHQLDDAPRFIDSARSNPDAVIAGSRIYGAVPASRRYGRVLTDVLVYLHTLSFTIKDSMCGYRLYPLAATMELLSHTKVGQRMDFDTDILVRLYWDGLEICHVDTPVRYQPDIPSHFDLLRDNIRITRMHTQLFLGMLLRIPKLVSLNLQRPKSHASH